LGIAHYSLDRREPFVRAIVEPFVDDYLSGRTPSPCVRCNRLIKFPALMRLATMLGARWVATGHYARVLKVNGQWRVGQAADGHKDQSYFLYALGQEELEHLMLPLSESHKPEVRQEALRRGLAGARKGESQDLCFVHEATYAEFVEQGDISGVENSLDPGLLPAAPDQVLSRLFTQQQAQRVNYNGFARPGFSCKDVETLPERYRQVVNDGKVPDALFAKHRY
jgi:hypothetical protein